MVKVYSGYQTREVLSANRTYYVRTDGSNSNTGLINTSGGAFLTIQKAVNIAANLDSNFYTTTISVADGTYNESVELKPNVGGGQINITGNVTTPSNCILNIPSNSNGFWCISSAGNYRITGFRITSTPVSTGIVRCLYAQGGGTYLEYGNIEFASLNTSGAKSHIWLQSNAIVRPIANYTISGACDYHWLSNPTGYLNALLLPSPITITITGTPNIAYFAIAQKTGVIDLISTDIVFSGSATGIRYSAVQNGVINTNGGGINYFPGNVSGTTATGGQYA
jgi:hypothetical protein